MLRVTFVTFVVMLFIFYFFYFETLLSFPASRRRFSLE